MKVLFLVEVDGSLSGGLFTATHNRIKTLLTFQGYSADVFCLSVYDGKILAFIKKRMGRKIAERNPSAYEVEGITYTTLYIKETVVRKVFKKLVFDSFYFKKALKHFKSAEYDLVSAHWGNPQGSFAFYLKKNLKLPYSLTLHGSDVHSLRANWKRKVVVRNMKHADAVFFVSQQLRMEAEKIGWMDAHSKSHIIHNAVDARVFYKFSELTVKRIRKSLQTHTYVVGFVGNLKQVKRADCLVDLFEEIQKKVKAKISFYIIGEGQLKPAIKKMAAKSSLDIRIIGAIPQKELPAYYNIMDCCVLPSRREGFPNVIGESHACGTPVIATDTGGIPEAIGDVSHLVFADEDNFLEEFSCKVNKILDTRERIDVEGFQWQDIVENEVSVWKEIHTSFESKIDGL